MGCHLSWNSQLHLLILRLCSFLDLLCILLRLNIFSLSLKKRRTPHMELFFLQPIWNSIINFDPHVFIWLGDNIYGDIRRPFKLFGRERTVGPWKNVPRFIPSSKQEMMLKYNKGKTIPGYSRLRQRTKVPDPLNSSKILLHYLILKWQILRNGWVPLIFSRLHCVVLGNRCLGWPWLWIKWCWKGIYREGH